MGKLWMPMSNFKKVSEDQKSAVLQHPDGHQITLAKNILSPSMLQQLAALPMHDKKGSNNPSKQPNLARGGKVKKLDTGGYSVMGKEDEPSPYTLANPDGSYSQPGVDATTGYSGGLPKNPEQLGALLRMSGVDSVNAFKNVMGLAGKGAATVAKPAIRFGQGLAGVDPNDQSNQKSIGEDATSPGLPNPSAGGGQGGGQGGGNLGGGGSCDPLAGGVKGLYGGHSPLWMYNQGFNDQMAGARQARDAQQQGSKMAMDSIDQYAQPPDAQHPYGGGLLGQNLDHLWNGWQAPNGQHVGGLLEGYQENGAIKQDVLTHQIDPNRWFSSGVAPKIITALGLLGAASGSRSGEAILGFVNNMVDNDVKSQMADKSAKINVFQANLMQLGNMKDAAQMTGIQHRVVLSALLEKAAQATTNKMAQAAYLDYAGQLWNQASKNLYDMKIGQVVGMNPQAGGGGGQGTDATGAPLPGGVQANPAYYSKFGPVNMPGGGIRFAGPNAEDANNSTKGFSDLDSALQHFKQTQQSWSLPKVGPFETRGRAEKESALEDVKGSLRNLASRNKRLDPQTLQSLEEKGNNLSANPYFFGGGKNQQNIADIAERNKQVYGNTMSSDLYGGYTPPNKGQVTKKYKP